MPTFSYKGLSATGQQIKGIVDAYDEIEAMEQARQLVYVVQDVHPVSESKSFLQRDLTKPHVKAKHLSVLCSQFAIILRSGVQVGHAISLVAEQTHDKYLKRVLTEAASDVLGGHSLADSLENKGPELPRVFIETIRAGEQSGNLAESFERMQKYYDKRDKVSAKVAGALTYPIFVLIIAVVVVAVLMVFVVPAITGRIASLGGEVPAITQFLINASNWVGAYWPFLLAFFLLLVIAIHFYGKTEGGKEFFAKLKLRVPVIGPIVRFSCAAQFANTMGTLMESGLPMARAINITSRVIDNYVVAREVGVMEAGLQEGRMLGECMEKSEWLPQTLIEMVSVGEQTGSLEETLNTMGEFYDSETQRVTDRALSLMEPTLLVLMAIFAGFIVIALYLPMFTMYANM